MNTLQSLIDNSELPILTALLLGLLTAISPCPLATNIAAVGYLGKDISNQNSVFLKGLLYVLGKIIAYTTLGIVLITVIKQGTETFGIQKVIGKWGEKLLPPVLVAIGVFMLFGDKLNLPKFGLNNKNNEKPKGIFGSVLLGIILSLAFCPSSALFYFGMLVPMSAFEAYGYLMLVLYAIATGLPVIVAALILAYGVGSLSKFYNRMQVFQLWLNRIVAGVFILVGIYYFMINLGIF